MSSPLKSRQRRCRSAEADSDPFPEVSPTPLTLVETLAPLALGLMNASRPLPESIVANLPEESGRRLPEWVLRILQRLAATLLPEACTSNATSGDWRTLGRFAGVIDRWFKFFDHEMPRHLPTEEQLAELPPTKLKLLQEKLSLEPLRGLFARIVERENVASEDLDTLAGEAVGRIMNWLRHLRESLTRLAAQQSAAAEHEFYRGVPEGYTSVIDIHGNFTHQTARTSTYVALLVLWPAIEQLRQRQPPITRVELRAWLKSQSVWASAPDQDAFNNLCDELKLGTKGRGRPRQRN